MSAEFLGPKGKITKWEELPTEVAMGMTYDDVIVAPRNSEYESRSQMTTEVEFGPYHLQIPVISAPMDTVTGKDMILTLHSLGAMGTLPRPKSLDEKKENLALCEYLSNEGVPCLYAVGMRPNPKENITTAFEEAKALKERGAQMVLIDIAHGGMESVKRTAMEIKDKLGLWIVAGNIATYEQAESYQKYGIDIGRVGVGGGGVCSTRIVTGIGVPQLSAVLDTVSAGIYVVADGGIRDSADVPKALAAGANMVMIGSKFGATTETPGGIHFIDGNEYKIVRGQASPAYMRDNGTNVTAYRVPEGVERYVRYKGSVAPIIQDIRGGITSAMSYVGAGTIAEFQERSAFIKVSDASQREARPHIIIG